MIEERSKVLLDANRRGLDKTDVHDNWFLQTQLQYERCLTRLGDRLNQCVTAALSATIDVDAAREAEHCVFQALTSELQGVLEQSCVAIALPLAAQTFVLSHVATGAEAPKMGLRTQRQLTSGQILTEQELRSLETSFSTRQFAWQQRVGWLLTDLHPAKAATSHLVNYLIEASVQRCTQTLEQLHLIQIQRQQQQALVAQNSELQQTNHLKSQFLANTSHEIRTPLSSILGFTHLLLQQGYNPANLRHQEYLKIILTSGQHLLGLINDILDLSKIEANQLTLEWETIEVAEVCQLALTLVREKAGDKGLELRLEIAPTITIVSVDGLRLKQMLFNLLSNAVKFTSRGTVGLQVAAIDGYLHFTVWDTGTGISQEQQALLFKPYSQIPNAAVARGEGTGLGLVLTKKLAELHGGWVEISSELDRGSRFTITLPDNAGSTDSTSTELLPPSVDRANEANCVQATDETPLEQLSALAAKSLIDVVAALPDRVRPNGILLVEDNLYNAKLMLTYLSRLGYEVTWAKNGQEMWQGLERSLPAVILMDINLPDVDGMALMGQLKEDDRYRQIPIIVQTALAMKGDRDRCLQAGAADYISKPIDLEALAKLLAAYIPVQAEG